MRKTMQETEAQQDLESSFATSETHASKKRKMVERVVVKVEVNGKKQQRNEGPPSDCWSWRKYGQKPIKGSPYPRGYYKCSTSKGCSAKKQVERCKTDASMLIITYTSTHNHPGPDFSLSPPTKLKQEEEEEEEERENNSLTHEYDHTHPTTPKKEEEEEMPQEAPATNSEDPFQYSLSPFNSSSDHTAVNQEETQTPFQEINLETANVAAYSEDPKPFSDDSVELSSLLKAEENDFYDELEELPTSSFFTAFMRSSSCEDRIAVNPS